MTPDLEDPDGKGTPKHTYTHLNYGAGDAGAYHGMEIDGNHGIYVFLIYGIKFCY